MKSKISYSTASILLTVALTGFLIGLCMNNVNDKLIYYNLLLLILLLIIPTLLYAPVMVKADKHYITVVSILMRHRIALSDIKSVELFQPTMGAIRIFASGGYLGYWGIFREKDLGKYTAYYGKASDCFLIRTKTGRKYVLGCKDPEAMVRFIEENLNNA